MSLSTIEHKIVNSLELAGKDFLKGLAVIEKYEAPAAALASLFFPAQVGAIQVGVTSVNLIQTAVVEIEQKVAASGVAKSTETNAQKLADVTALVSPTVISLLASEGVKIDTTGVQAIINAVVAVLKVQIVPVVAAPVAA
jgi:hypothetical protein